MQVLLKSVTPNAETTIVEIARVSSSRVNKSEAPEGLINYLIRNKHWSPFQHGHMTVEITTSKAIAIQYLRHLSFTFQEFSQRYAVVENIEPIEFRLQAEENRQSSTDVIGSVEQEDGVFVINFEEEMQPHHARWLEKVAIHLQNSLNLYKEGLELGIAKECARMILPMAAQTTLYMTGTVRSWVHLLDIRDDPHAQKEAQEIARAIKEIFKQEFPIISKARGWS